MKIIIHCPLYKQLGFYYEMPIGMAYISSQLKHAGYNVQLINENEERLIRPDFDQWLAKNIRESEILLTGGLSTHYHAVKKIIDNARSINPAIKIIAGGGLISSEPELMVNDLNVNHGVVGEGEEAVLGLLRGEITDRIVYAESIRDLDSLQFPDFDGLLVDNYLDRQVQGDEHYSYPFDEPRILPLISSRSCPYDCQFCFHPTGRIYRQRSISDIDNEVRFHKARYRINGLAILDELIAQDYDRMSKICGVMRQYGIKWMCQARVDKVTRDMLTEMKESGCFQISFGIEHVDANILKGMKKHITQEHIDNALKLAYEIGIGIQGNLLFGSPDETPQSVQYALNWWSCNLKYAINLTNVIPYPGSGIYKKYVASGHINPIEYIRKGCHCVAPHYNFPESGLVQQYNAQYNHIPAKVIKKIVGNIDKYRGQMYNITVQCPHCNSTVSYQNLYMNATGSHFKQNKGYRIACRVCNARMDFNLT